MFQIDPIINCCLLVFRHCERWFSLREMVKLEANRTVTLINIKKNLILRLYQYSLSFPFTVRHSDCKTDLFMALIC